jgi:ATP/ADP translocase
MLLPSWVFFAFLPIVLLFIGGIVFFLFTQQRKGTQRLFENDDKVFEVLDKKK